MSDDISRKAGLVRTMLGVSATGGIGAMIWYFSERSMDKNAWLWGYSRSKLLLGMVLLALVLLVLYLALRAWRDNTWVNQLIYYIDERASDVFLSWLMVINFSFIIIGAALTCILMSPLGNYVSIVQALFRRSLPLTSWLLLLGFLVIITGTLSFAERYRRIRWREASAWHPALIIFLLLIYLVHWTILFFRLDLLTSIPGWFWIFHEKGYSIRDLLLPGILLISLSTIILILRSPGRRRNIYLLILLGLFLQFAFGFVEGGGFDSIRRKYADTQHSAYAMHACDKPDLYQAIANYEEAYGDQRYVQTKPPGVLTFYILTQKLSNLVQPEKTFEGRYARLTWFITFTYPIISMLTILVLYMLLRPMIGAEQAILPCILYVVSPNVVLMPLYLDQALYPLVFTSGALLFMRMFKKQSFVLAIAAGAGCYLAMFLSFSLITILPFALVLVGLDLLADMNQHSFMRAVKLCAGLLLGVALAYIVFALLLNYDFFTRYENMMIVHRYDDFVARFGIPADESMIESGYKPAIGQVLYAIFLNNITFAAWAGFPVYLLFLIGFIRSAFPYLKRSVRDLDVLLGGFTVTFVALNLFGDTTGEVARLWIFMLPIILVYTAREMTILFNQRRWGYYLIAACQLVTVILTYKFQDFIL